MTAPVTGFDDLLPEDPDDPGAWAPLPSAYAIAAAARDVERDGNPHDTPEQRAAQAFDLAALRAEREARAGEPPMLRKLEALAATASGPRRLGPGRVDAADLLAEDIAPLRWIVPDVLPEGTTVLAAAPKVGKSCLVYQACVEASLGGDLLGRRVAGGSVLYLALEDGRRRGQDRLRIALRGRTMPQGRLEVWWSAPKLGEGLEDELRAWLDAHPDAVLVALDTLGKVRSTGDGRRNAYQVDVEDLARIHDLFRDRSVALLVVHHTRKDAGDDFLEAVSGTYGIAGSADTTIVLRRRRMEATGRLLVAGRDVPDLEIAVAFDAGRWEVSDYAPDEMTHEAGEVLADLRAHGPAFASAVAGRLHRTRQTVQNTLARLEERGAVTRVRGGYAAVSGVSAVSRSPVGPLTLPSVSSVSDGDGEGLLETLQTPDTRARAGEGATVRCADYAAHRFDHRYAGGSWTCARCAGS